MLPRKKLLVVCPHPEDMVPGQRLKYEQYFESWRKSGYHVTVSSFASVRLQKIMYKKGRYAEKIFWVLLGYLRRIFDLCRLPFYDVVYIFLWVTPAGPPLMERLFKLANPNIVYDIDDAIFVAHKSVSNPWVDKLKGKGKPFYLMKIAKHVVTCTPYLTETALKYSEHVTDISSTINTETYQPVNGYVNDGTITLGWSGSHSTSRFMYLLKDALLELREIAIFKLVVMGDSSFAIDGIEVEALEWSVEKEVGVLQRFDIGLYPLPLDDQWVMGKSGLKALQYMALGVPTVATAIGANFRVIENGVDGFLVTSKEEWIEKLVLLIENPNLRRKLGEAARKKVDAEFSVNANCSKYLAILDRVSKCR